MRIIGLLAVWLCMACDDGGPGNDAAAATIDAAMTEDSGGGAIDAAPPADAPAVGVECMTEVCVPVTTAGCCHHPDTMQSCQPIGKTVCDGELFGCDGREDCLTAGEFCCGYAPGSGTGCAADCTGVDTDYVCHGDADCPAIEGFCCAGVCQATACQ